MEFQGLTVEFSFDDGHELDVRCAQLIEKYGFKGTFYISPLCYFPKGENLSMDQIRKLKKRGHAIGYHTATHPPDMKRLDESEVRWEVTFGREMIEKAIGQKLTRFCYPKGKYNPGVTKILAEEGYTCARTVDIGHTKKEFDIMRKPTTVHIHPSRREFEGRTFVAYSVMKINEAIDQHKKKGNGYIHIWGHSWEIDDLKMWDEFEEILIYLKKKIEQL
jgi:peptidoglycan-N-acetylglucosamine deacetylase